MSFSGLNTSYAKSTKHFVDLSSYVLKRSKMCMFKGYILLIHKYIKHKYTHILKYIYIPHNQYTGGEV